MSESTKKASSDKQRAAIAITVSAILIAVLIAGAVYLFDRNEISSGADAGQSLDVANASFYLADRGVSGELVSLTEGVYYPPGSDGNDPHVRLIDQWHELDVNSDGFTDVVAVLEWTGDSVDTYDAWRGVYAWLGNNNNEFIPYEHLLAWEWNCAGVDQETEQAFTSFLPGAEGGITTKYNIANRCGSDVPTQQRFESLFIAIVEGYPVNTSFRGFVGATEGCARLGDDFTGSDYIALPEVQPLAFPAQDAPPVSARSDFASDHASIVVWQPDTTDTELIRQRGGYLPASMQWTNGPILCAWVHESALPDQV